MIRAGTLPGRKPGTLIWLPTRLYAEARSSESSSNGTSIVILMRVGLRASLVAFTAEQLSMAWGRLGNVFESISGRIQQAVGAGRFELPISCSQSRRASHYA